MALALVASTATLLGTGAASNITTPAINTTGATLLVIHYGNYESGASVNQPPTDSKANTWIALTAHGVAAGPRSRFWYAKSPIVGSGHQFTTSNTANYAAMSVAAFSGAHLTAPFDQENGATAASGSPPQSCGSITPSVNGALIVAGMSEYDNFVGAFTINSGLTILGVLRFASASNFGSAMAYLVQTSAAAINPAWSWTSGGDQRGVSVASFKPLVVPMLSRQTIMRQAANRAGTY